jgi:hypothetical protein
MLFAAGQHGGGKPMRANPALLRSPGFKTGLNRSSQCAAGPAAESSNYSAVRSVMNFKTTVVLKLKHGFDYSCCIRC